MSTSDSGGQGELSTEIRVVERTLIGMSGRSGSPFGLRSRTTRNRCTIPKPAIKHQVGLDPLWHLSRLA